VIFISVKVGKLVATKSFITEFKFSSRSGLKLLKAIEGSKKVDGKINQRTQNVTDKKDINKIIDSFLGDN